MATTIPGAMQRIKDALDSHFDTKGFEWKSQESQSEHRQQKPTVYLFVCSNRNEANFPVVCPSVTVELAEASVDGDSSALGIVCHCVVVNSAILEREKTVMLDDRIHYAFLDEDGYTDEGVVEALFADCLLLAEETMNALRAQAGISQIKLIPPSVFDDFPYCQCQVTASVSMLNSYIHEDFL